ncbi:MAG: substrate-binding domain-containing protein, partial [Acidobacteria bacterium]|nr:substrate-binding domain-containing protein [Acidobacteriota bacterium]
GHSRVLLQPLRNPPDVFLHLFTREAARHLFELGHRKIAFLSVGSEHPDYTQSVHERFLGFLDAYREAGEVQGGSVRWVRPYSAGEEMKEHIGWIAERLQEDPGVTAVLCVEAYDLECVRRAVEGLDLTIPDDLSVIGFDGGSGETDRMKGWTTHFGDKQWTWIDQSEEQIGREAVRLLHDLIESASEVRQVVIPTRLRPGDSVSCLGAARAHGMRSEPKGERSPAVPSADERG